MCGIAGIWNRDGGPVIPEQIAAMTDIQAHRGPDDRGIYLAGNIGLGHRRLAIIDLTPGGHQPMPNDERTLWLTYNGEVYNYIELREELQALGVRFRSKSDSEVLLKSYERWGPECVKRLNGIFAFAIWDERKQKLFCARDRFGVKPFHYAQIGTTFLFASEIKGILASEIVPREPNWSVVHRYLTLNLTHVDSQTFFQHVYELPAAHTLTVERTGLTLSRYWDLPPVEPPPQRPDHAWAEEYEQTLHDAVRLQMRSDVPVGCCLSGGLDSTTLAHIATGLSPIAMKTFTAYLSHPTYDERKSVNAFVKQVGPRVEPHFVSPDLDAWMGELSKVVYHHDEPHAGYTSSAQWEVMRLAHECGIKVVLDGQGADESLGGYNYFVESLAADLLRARELQKAFSVLVALTDRRGSGVLVGSERLFRAALRAWRSRESLYRLEAMVSQRTLPFDEGWVRQIGPVHVPTIERSASRLENEIANALQVTSLPALLTFEDRASMAFSIESRVPYLDHRLVEIAFRLPRHLRVDRTTTKVILRRIAQGRLPQEIVRAPLKRVFGTPYQLWFSPALVASAREILTSQSFRDRPFVDPKRLSRWIESIGGAASDQKLAYQVWNLVNLELWFRTRVETTLPNVASIS